ncbi:uncharacterized protein GGS22DRAFT_171638 [Annulohypoxylon maeteangense]|uniref:uncharacterized protein n=1 Tax=Annulohypoxylon maeteangense TaxID=1927788 RepID=UPI002007BC9D|nr:uncharacterized protein GGS22DRAFT_171638 [Annulohypoxylon maeteangense]KAI0881700.1 hypothetical protein GGS22DRAFT_171638 [Annulohypoxylon maeteangense]
MYLSNTMLSLPPSLLVLLAAATQTLAQHHPTAIRKMSLDEGEKIFPEYYAFGPAPAQVLPRQDSEELLLSGNSSAAVPFLPPYPRHLDYHYRSPEPRAAEAEGQGQDGEDYNEGVSEFRRSRDILSKLQGRQFACPSDTHSCTNIDQPNYCCASRTTCFVVTNAPEAGNVGCCPVGQNCGVTVGACASGATACPANVGGGCCIAGFVCAEVGCIASAVSVITQSSSLTSPMTTISPTTQIITTTATVTNPTTITASGGIPPYRPTSGSSALTTTPPSSSPTPSTSYCPTGFYPCLARAGGGCCRTGRDCSTTSCPAAAPSTTIVNANGATIVVPLSDAQAVAATATATATCAAGWFMCGEGAGPTPGCCPDGYGCGTASCTLSASTATATVLKELPSSGGVGRGCGLGVWGWVNAGVVVGGLVWGFV